MPSVVKNFPEEYSKGYSIFCGLKIFVNRDVLIPRIETEELVYLVIDFIRNNPTKKSLFEEKTLLEIGTGSGCIAIALANEIPDIKITAVDISPKALRVAKKNATFHKVTHRITFCESDLISAIGDKTHFDAVICNLPYIPTNRIKDLDSSVKDFEPLMALDGGYDGFDVHRKLFRQMTAKNVSFDLLLAEIDDTQSEISLAETRQYFNVKKSDVIKDKYGYIRFLKLSF